MNGFDTYLESSLYSVYLLYIYYMNSSTLLINGTSVASISVQSVSSHRSNGWIL